MALGRKGGRTGSFWVATSKLPRSPGHPFYEALNSLLEEAGFDQFAEKICREYYAEVRGRPSIPPGTYFRMLMVGYFEGIDSQRGIAWRCSDSLALRSFLGVGLTDRVPDHSSLTVIRQRLPLEAHERVFRFVLEILEKEGFLEGRTLGVDATTLEANAAMKSIVRRDSGDTWRDFVKRLAAEEEGIEDPDDEDGRRFDRRRGSNKKVSNRDWESKSDPESRITKMKDGRTKLAYKAEHVVDLSTEVILSGAIYAADQSDSTTLTQSLERAEKNTKGITKNAAMVADKGYHKAESLSECTASGYRTYVPERMEKRRRRWRDKPREWRDAFYGNRRRVRGKRGRALQRRRSEILERSFAHVCETGGARRTYLRGRENVQKRYFLTLAGRNLGLLMRYHFGFGTPRSLQGVSAALLVAVEAVLVALQTVAERVERTIRPIFGMTVHRFTDLARVFIRGERAIFSTGC